MSLTPHEPVSLLLQCISVRSLNERWAISRPRRSISALPEILSPQSTPCETLRLELASASLDWFLTPIPRSQQRFARQNVLRPPAGFRPPSSSPGIDRLASSLAAMTQRTFTRFSSQCCENSVSLRLHLYRFKLAMTVSSLARVSRRNAWHWWFEHQIFNSIARISNMKKSPSMPCTSVSNRFHALFIPLPGYFSAFPHGTSPLSVLRDI